MLCLFCSGGSCGFWSCGGRDIDLKNDARENRRFRALAAIQEHL